VLEENYWFRRHEAAYLFTGPVVAGRAVLEVGCGEGYGTAMLADAARLVVGIDYDPMTVAHATAAYPRPCFLRANLAALPIRTGTIDVVAALQVVEHVWDHNQFLGECRRVLRSDGLLLLTTPNRLTFTPHSDEPVNPFHCKEFTGHELTELLANCGFGVDAVLGLHAGPTLERLDERHGGSFVAAQLASPPRRWSGQLRRDVASVTAGDFRILAADVHAVDDALDLVVLARPCP
jgi:SAM-dependent methyltransferase